MERAIGKIRDIVQLNGEEREGVNSLTKGSSLPSPLSSRRSRPALASEEITGGSKRDGETNT